MDEDRFHQSHDDVDSYESVRRKLFANRKRTKNKSSERHKRHDDKRKGKRNRKKMKRQSSQIDEVKSSCVPEHVQQEHALADMEQKMNACELGDEPRPDNLCCADANEPPRPDQIGSNDTDMPETSEQLQIEQQLRELNNVDGGVESAIFPDQIDSAAAQMMDKADHLIAEGHLTGGNSYDCGEACQDHTGNHSLEEVEDVSIDEELRELNSVDGGEELLFGEEDEGDEFRTRLLEHDLTRTCDNCHRRCFTCNQDSPYYFDTFLVYSHNIKPLSTPLRKIKSHR